MVKERRLRMLGHIMRLPNTRHANISFNWVPENGKRNRGSPQTTWKRTTTKDLTQMGLTWVEA
jgi:hypothetical protein